MTIKIEVIQKDSPVWVLKDNKPQEGIVEDAKLSFDANSVKITYTIKFPNIPTSPIIFNGNEVFSTKKELKVYVNSLFED